MTHWPWLLLGIARAFSACPRNGDFKSCETDIRLGSRDLLDLEPKPGRSAKCSAWHGCNGLGFSGDCCPDGDVMLGCCSARRLTSATHRKGITVDDTTLHYCAGRVPQMWPNTEAELRSLRIFQAWNLAWPPEERRSSWRGLRDLVKARKIKVLVGAPVTCNVDEDTTTWQWTKEFLQMIGPEHVMGLAIGNELELLTDHAEPECIREMWEGGRLWQIFTNRVAEFDEIPDMMGGMGGFVGLQGIGTNPNILMGFQDIPVTSVFTAAVLSGNPFMEVPGKALVNTFLRQAVWKYRRRYAFTFNVYPYFDPNLHMNPGSQHNCSRALERAICWDAPHCLAQAIMIAARQHMQMLTGRPDDIFWIGEIGWSSPRANALHTDMRSCDNFSSLATFEKFYNGFLQWDLVLQGPVRSPDHIFYFTLRDALNFGVQEFFGLLLLGRKGKLRSSQKSQLSWRAFAFMGLGLLLFLSFACTCLCVRCPLLQRLIHFLETDTASRAGRVEGGPVEIAASKATVSALLDYMYGGQPEVTLEAGLELLRLAEAYDLPKLAAAIEAGFRASLDSSAALKVLQEALGLHALKAACEEKVARDFETCSQHPDFGKLSSGQLGRILKREDLVVSREESVLKGLLNWLKISKDRHTLLALLLQHVDFHSISVDNLLRLSRFTLSGSTGDDLHREVDEALRLRCQKRTQSLQNVQPKRRCLQHWSPDLGASSGTLGRQVLYATCNSMWWHKGAIYGADYHGRVFCWTPGDPSTMRAVAGEGARVSGISDLGFSCDAFVSPTGGIFVVDYDNGRLLSFENGSGRLVLDNIDADDIVCCSPNGVVYVMNKTLTLQKLVGSRLQTVTTFESLPTDLQFSADVIFISKEEVIYILDKTRILRISSAESFKPVVVGRVPTEQHSELFDFVVTEGGTIYVSDFGQRKVLAIRLGDPTCTEITFTRGNRKRSYLRLIEMVWPRPQAGKNPGAGKASVALEQVLQSKLSGTSCGYRGAPLALLLKPCLEGASSLCFIHCLRLEQAHLSQLVTAAPLLTKIFQWMSNERKLLNKNKHTEGSPTQQSLPPRQSRGPYVPPLHLDAHLGSTGGSCTLSTEPLEDVDGVTATSGADPTSASGASSESNTRRSPSKSAPMVGATSEDTVTGGEGGTGEASAGVKHLLSDSTEEEDSQVNKLIAQLLQVKRRTVEALEQDARCSSGAFQELDSLLGHIMSTREAHGSGPDERETNLKLVYEQVYRSIQRSTEEVSKIRHEIQELESFCRKGYIPPLYDAYSASQQDIQKMKEMQQAASRVTEEKEVAKGKLNISVPWAAPQVIEIPQLPLSCLQADPEVAQLPQPYIEGTASAASSSSGSSSSSAPGTDVRRASFTAGYAAVATAPPAPGYAAVPLVAPPAGYASSPAVNPPSWAQAMKDPTPAGAAGDGSKQRKKATSVEQKISYEHG
eukprot:s375_g18.t1